MLGYLLAVLVGTGSVGLYVAAFFFPEIHRKPDFIWGGVGLFYALALWIYAKEMSGGILVGQAASVALLGWFGWQTVKLRQLVPIDWQTAQPINKKPERSTTKAATTPAPKDPQSTGKKSSSRATNPTIDRQTPPPPAVESAPKSTAERFPIAPNRAAQKPAPSNPAVRVEVNPTPVNQPPVKVEAIEPAIELEEQAWIRLEVKPAPDSTSLVKEVVRSEPPAKPLPTATPTPKPEAAPPSPTAKSNSPQETLHDRLPPEQTGNLDKLIAELESEI